MTDVAGARFAQLTYTSFDRRGGRGGGWQVKDISGELSDVERGRLESRVVTAFAWPVEIPRFVASHTQLPRRLVYARLPGSGSAYWHSVPAGPDGTGRPGNVFVHVVLDRTPDAAHPPFRPVDLAGSDHWLRPFGPDQVLATDLARVPDPPWSSRDPGSVLTDLVDPDRMPLLAVLLDAVREALTGGPPVVLAVPVAGAELAWIAAVSRLMSPGTSRRFHWSTSERVSSLRAAWEQGLHLAVVPVTDLVPGVDTAGAVVVREDEVPILGSYGGVPHEGACSPPVPVTAWSVLAGVVLQDRDTAVRGLTEMDRVAAEAGDLDVDPAWPMAMTARLLEIPDTEEADAVLRAASPAILSDRLRRVAHDPVLRAIGDESTASAYGYAERVRDTPEATVAAAIYLQRAAVDREWLRRPGGAPTVQGPGLVPAARRIVEEADARAVRGGPSGVDTAGDVLRMLDLLVRGNLLPNAELADDAAGEAGRRLVERTVVHLLVQPEAGRAVVASAGRLVERTQAVFVRPLLASAAHGTGMTGDLVPASLLAWAYPVPPSPSGALSGGEPDPLLVELAAQVTATVADPSAFRTLALWGLAQRAGRGEDVAEAEQRLLAPGMWTPRAVHEALTLLSVDRIAPALLDVLLNGPPDADVLALVDRLTRGSWGESTEAGRDALLAARVRDEVQLTWGARDTSLRKRIERLIESVEWLAERCPVTAPDILVRILAATALSAVTGRQNDDIRPALATALAHAAERGLTADAAIVVEGCMDDGPVGDVAIGSHAVLSAPSAPWVGRSAPRRGRLAVLARLPVPVPDDGPPLPLLDQVIRIRRQRKRIGSSFVRDVLQFLVQATHSWGLDSVARKTYESELADFVPRWFAALDGPEEPAGKLAGLRRAFGGSGHGEPADRPVDRDARPGDGAGQVGIQGRGAGER